MNSCSRSAVGIPTTTDELVRRTSSTRSRFSYEYWHDGGLPAGGVRLTTTSTGAAAGAGYPEGGAEAMTGQSTLDLVSSAETEDQLYAGSQQPLLQPQAADAASASLRRRLRCYNDHSTS